MRDRKDPSAATPESHGHRARTAILCFCLLAAGILAAWQIHVFLRLRASKRAPLGQLPPRGPWATSLPAWPEGTPAELAMGPAGAAGLTVLDADPLDLTPPEGAFRQWAFGRDLPGVREQHAVYGYGGTQEEASSHYAGLLGGRGFSPVRAGREKPGDPDRVLVYLKDRIRVTVSLRKSRQDAKMIRVAVTSMEWRRSEPATQPARD